MLGEIDWDGLTLGEIDSEIDGEILALGDTDGLMLVLGLTDGEIELDILGESEGDSEGLILGDVEPVSSVKSISSLGSFVVPVASAK